MRAPSTPALRRARVCAAPADRPARRCHRFAWLAVSPCAWLALAVSAPVDGASSTRQGALFLHIPKTGGHTIDALLEAPVVPGRLCRVPGAGASTASTVWAKCECAALLSLEADGAFVAHYRQQCGPQRPVLTMLRDPATRAISAWNHQVSKNRGASRSLRAPTATGGVLHPACQHDRAFCEALADPAKCRLRGSCGLFQNHQVLTLVGSFGRSLSDMVSLERNSTALLETALGTLTGLEAFGLTEHMRTSVCLIAHTLGWREAFEQCCASQAAAPPGPCAAFRSDAPARNARPHAVDDTQAAFAESVNALDRALYTAAEHIFWHRVRVMEVTTKTKFPRPTATSTVAGTAAGAPHTAAPAASRPDQVLERGLAIFALGQPCLQEAFKSAQSARESFAGPLHVTLLTDTAGVLETRDFAGSGVFDRTLSAFGRVTVTEEQQFANTKSANPTPAMGSRWNLLVKVAKQVAIGVAARLYKHAVFVDADTYHCDNRTLVQMFSALEAGHHLVTASPARNSKTFPGHDDCEERVARRFTRPIREINTGVLGFAGGAPIVQRMLQRWRFWYNDLLSTDCGRSGQDQKSFRFAVAEAQSAEPAAARLRSLHFWNTTPFRKYSVSMQPFNCRVRAKDDFGRRTADYAHCAESVYKHCALLHGHSLAMRNPRRTRTPYSDTPRAQKVFLHIPKTAGASIKAKLVPWLDKSAGSLHVNDAFAALGRGGAWAPPGNTLYGAFASSACDWLAPRRIPCGYFTMLRDPIDRLVSELNYCLEVEWIGDQTCTGPRGAAALEATVLDAFQRGGPGEALVAFARARGNVMLEHVAGVVAAADFHYAGMPADWHRRNVSERVNPIDVRRRRQGPANMADLSVAKHLLQTQYVVLGFTDDFNRSITHMAAVLAPGRTFTPPRGTHAHVHNHATFTHRGPFAVSREQLSKDVVNEVASLLSLDLLLYAHAKELAAAPRGRQPGF